MCSTLVDSLECYMDELVDSFEDFVKKSLIIMTVAICAIIAIFVYVLRVITERQVNTHPSLQERVYSEPPIEESQRSNSTLKSKSDQTIEEKSLQKDYIKNSYVLQYSKSIPSTCTTSPNTALLPCVPSFEERVLRDIGFTNCSKNCNSSKGSLTHHCSDSRLTIPSLPTCGEKQHSTSKQPCNKYISVKNSRCSICCDDEGQ